MTPSLVIALVSGLVLLAPFSGDIYLPSMPAMAKAFGSDHGSIQLTLSIFMLGMGAGQLVIGPLSDRFGRRIVLQVTMALYVAASLGCMVAPNVETLLAFRLVQSVGACASMVVGRAIVRDSFEIGRAAQAFAYIGTAVALGPIVAPIVGGKLEVWFGWRSNFACLAVMGIVACAAIQWLLVETNRAPNPDATRPARLLRNFMHLARDPAYVGYGLVLTLGYGGIFAFISGSAFVLIERLGVAPDDFGLLFAVAIGTFGVGTITASQISRRVGADRMILIGATIIAASGVTLVALAYLAEPAVWSVVAPIAVYTLGSGFVFPNGQAGAIGPYPQIAGTAAALVGAVQMVGAALLGALVGQLHDGTQMPMVHVIGGCALVLLLSFYFLVWRRRPAAHGPGDADAKAAKL